MMRAFLNFFRRRPTVSLYRPGTLGGEPMTEAQIAQAIRGGKLSPAFRAAVQIIERYALDAHHSARNDRAIKEGMADKYLMADSYLSDVLGQLQFYAEGGGRPKVRKVKGEE